jgi:hypothetical protein
MSSVKSELSTDNAISKTNSGSTRKNGDGESRVRAVREDGVELLRRAADKRVGQYSEKLATLLITRALGGELPYAKALVGFAERKRPRPAPVKKPRRPSMAMRLAAEMPWRGEEEEGTGTRD